MLNGAVEAERLAVPAELWEKPRSGELIIAQPVVRESVVTLLAQPAARLLIHHGRSDESVLQAEELRAWLIALAVDGNRIELNTDGEHHQSLNLELVGITVEGKQTVSKGNP
jgi:hypothetical protein